MGLASRFLPHSVQLNTLAGTSAWINEIMDTSPNEGVSLFEESTGSGTDTDFVASKDIQPTMPISSVDLSFLATCGMTGLFIQPPVSGVKGLLAYGRELPLGALPTAIGTGNHITMSVSDGLLVPVSAQASHNQPATLALMLHAILGTSGTSGAAPMIFTASQAINAGAGGTVNLYTAGVIKYNSRLVKGIISQSVHFGLSVHKESTDGEVYPTHVSIIARTPKIEFSTRDVALVAEVADGVALTSFGVYFRNITANGQRVPIATTSHIAITGVNGMITPGAVGLKHRQPGSAAFTITPALNSTLLTISAAAAIPAS